MRRRIILVALLLAVPAAAFAHLCNDVFRQAKDNLAVKVDIRDGQLRIGKTASFRVYVLNTMDRGIASIRLEIRSEHFNATVKPSGTWRKFPQLQTTRQGGKKEYFDVSLERKPGVPDGKYKIGLRLFDNQKRNREFASVDMDAAAGLWDLPRFKSIQVDGRADRAEWGAAFVGTDFYAYVAGKNKKIFRSQPAKEQTRFRLACDGEHLYALFEFQGGADAAGDEATLHVAAGADVKPVTVSVDRLSGKVTCAQGTTGVEAKVSADKTLVECKVPFALLGLRGAGEFHLNCTRTVTAGDGKRVSYWRGNAHSLDEPMVYGQFRLAPPLPELIKLLAAPASSFGGRGGADEPASLHIGIPAFALAQVP